MKTHPHNPDYKLISVLINGKEFVYGETNTGENKGLEVHYLNDGQISKGHYYSRRYTDTRKLPMVYNELYYWLQSIVKYCKPGHKLYLENMKDFHMSELEATL